MLCQNEYQCYRPIQLNKRVTIQGSSPSNSQSNSKQLSNLLPLKRDEQDICYNVESLRTNILVKETINFILDEIYICKKVKTISKKLVLTETTLTLVSERICAISN